MSLQPVTLELQYDERDLLRVVPFIQRKVSGIKWYVLPFFAFFSVAFGALLTIYHLATMNVATDTLFHAVAAPLSLIALGSVYAVITVRRVPLTVKKMMATNPVLSQPFTLSFSEAGIENNTAGAETKYEWSFVKMCYEKLGGLIIVFQPNSFHFIPAHKISEENYLAIRKMLTEKIGITEN
jgi:hypothetical protein